MTDRDQQNDRFAVELKRLATRAIRSKKRILLAFDRFGVHVSETLCVIHDCDSGECQYHAKPIASFKHPRKFREALKKLIGNHR